MKHALPLALITAALATNADAQDVAGCLPAAMVHMQVQFGDAAPVAAVLEGGFETPLRLLEAGSGRLLWSAGGRLPAAQIFAGMDAAFTGSLTAVDLDADGLHDRIYAGDMNARLWRIDLHHGAAASRWASAGVFADFSNAEGRSFLAAPDVSMSAPPAAAPWLNIAIGTAAPGNANANNRFYALRDHATQGSWSDEQFARWIALREADLLRVVARAPPTEAPEHSPAGWYMELGSGHVVAPALTVNNRAMLVIAATLPRAGQPCEIFARMASFDLAQRRVVVPPGSTSNWHLPLSEAVPVAAGFQLGPIEGGIAPCTLAGQRVPDCDVDTRPRRTWWRRGDAE
jgi:hypothetical protein